MKCRTSRFDSLAVILFAVTCVPATASSQTTDGPATFRGATVNMTPEGLTLTIDVLRWSSESDRDAVASALAGERDGAPLLSDSPTLGHLWRGNSGLGYSLKYARRTTTPDGGVRITLVTGRPLGTYSRDPWKATDASVAAVHDFTVIELRLDSNGTGEGKMSVATDVTIDAQAGLVALKDYDTAPVLLDPVQREPRPYGESASLSSRPHVIDLADDTILNRLNISVPEREVELVP